MGISIPSASVILVFMEAFLLATDARTNGRGDNEGARRPRGSLPVFALNRFLDSFLAEMVLL